VGSYHLTIRLHLIHQPFHLMEEEPMGTGMVLLMEQGVMEVVMDLWEVMEGWVDMVG